MVHAVCWLIFLIIPGFFNPFVTKITPLSLVQDLAVAPRIANGILLIIVFYANYHYAVPRLWFRGNYVRFSFTLVCCITLLIVVNTVPQFWTDSWYTHLGDNPAAGLPASALSSGVSLLGPSHNFFMFLLVYGSSFSFAVYQQWQQTKEEKLHAEISFLKAQINPHFLFNTLNSIYSLTLTKSDDAPEALIRLSSMMRYAVTEAHQHHVSLSKELEYISNYINLQQLRLPAKASAYFDVSGEINGYEIAPLILMPFVENAFKYGVNAEENSSIDIRIHVYNKELVLRVHNRKVSVRDVTSKRSTGIGLENTRLRLELLYAGKHELIVKDDEKDFTVHLTMILS